MSPGVYLGAEFDRDIQIGQKFVVSVKQSSQQEINLGFYDFHYNYYIYRYPRTI